MAYCTRNFKTKKEMKTAVANGEEVRVFQPGPFSHTLSDGEITIEGPHYPQPHRWYARVRIENKKITKVIS